MDPLQALRDAGQSIWIDDITRASLADGSLERWISEHHLTGLTSNPSIFNLAIAAGGAYDEQIRELAARSIADDEAFLELALDDLRTAADLFLNIHRETNGIDGWVSLEVSPLLAHDAAGTAEQAQQLHAQAKRDNLYIKIPGTAAGLAAIEECIFIGIPVNVTLLFSTAQYLDAAEAYMRGLERRVATRLSPAVSSVASLFVSRWDRAVADSAPPVLRNRLGIAMAAQTYEAYLELLQSERWLRLANQGARPQRLLWASTGTKDPEASDVLYVEALAAPFTINTMPMKTLLAFADHGRVERTLQPADADEARETIADFERANVDLGVLAARLQLDGAEDFVRGWVGAVESVARKRRAAA